MQQNHKTLWHDLTMLKSPICSVLFTSPTLSAMLAFPLSTSGIPCPHSEWLTEDVMVHVCRAKQETWLGGGFISLPLFEKKVAGKIKRKIGGKGHALD